MSWVECRKWLIARGLLPLLVAGLIGVVATAAPDMDRVILRAQQQYDSYGLRTVLSWREMVEGNQHLNDQQKLTLVNDFFNRRIQFSDDRLLWKMKDYWATPLETMGVGAGDCEDFSIAKYVTLRMLGVSIDKMRITYVRAQIGGEQSRVTQAHMVLGYYSQPDSEPLLLDNLIGEILPASRRPDLKPVFSFNSEGLWAGGGAPVAKNPGARLSRWRSLLARMQQEGLQ